MSTMSKSRRAISEVCSLPNSISCHFSFESRLILDSLWRFWFSLQIFCGSRSPTIRRWRKSEDESRNLRITRFRKPTRHLSRRNQISLFVLLFIIPGEYTHTHRRNENKNLVYNNKLPPPPPPPHRNEEEEAGRRESGG